MALTKVGVVYSANQLLKRRVIVSDTDDSEVDSHKLTLLPGELWFDVPIEEFEQFSYVMDEMAGGAYNVDSYLALHLGAPPSSDVCLVVDENNAVVAVCAADPRIDDHPAGFLIQDAVGATGDIYDFQNQTVIQAEDAP